MLLIHTSSVSNRLRYIASLMVKQILGIDVRLTTSSEEFNGYEGPKISYDRKPFTDGIFIEASELLFESAIKPIGVRSSTIDGIPVLFKCDNPLSALPFDPFAAAFFMVSRYEEYHPHQKDSFGRYQATESIAWKAKFLEIPVVHCWAEMLEGLLCKHYRGLKFPHQTYHYAPTIDIDHTWCYLGRTFARTMGGFARSFLNGHFQEISDRFRVLAGMDPDPYDSYSFINKVHEPFANNPLYFILFADYGGNDNNVSINSEAFHRLLLNLDQHGNVGIHPSLSSGKHLSKFVDEYEGLCEVLDRDVTISRQHFLKLSMPRTYRTMIQLGITDDYSMGYASHSGFRAGIAIPFPFYDLTQDEATSLMIHSVTLMDVTMRDYLRLSKVESLEKISKMIQTIRAVNGEFVSLWHNESLGDTGRWEGWRNVYEELVKMASS